VTFCWTFPQLLNHRFNYFLTVVRAYCSVSYPVDILEGPVRFLNGLVIFDLLFAAVGVLAAWYTGQTWAYYVCVQIAVSGLVLKIVAKAYDSIKKSWSRKEK